MFSTTVEFERKNEKLSTGQQKNGREWDNIGWLVVNFFIFLFIIILEISYKVWYSIGLNK